MTTATADRRDDAHGTTGQRARAALVSGLGAVLNRLPAALVNASCDAVGELWYRLAPRRGAIARGNLAHVAEWLAAEGRGSARARAAASDPDALERLVRAAFRHAVRNYAETLRGAAIARDVRRHLVVDEPRGRGRRLRRRRAGGLRHAPFRLHGGGRLDPDAAARGFA